MKTKNEKDGARIPIIWKMQGKPDGGWRMGGPFMATNKESLVTKTVQEVKFLVVSRQGRAKGRRLVVARSWKVVTKISQLVTTSWHVWKMRKLAAKGMPEKGMAEIPCPLENLSDAEDEGVGGDYVGSDPEGESDKDQPVEKAAKFLNNDTATSDMSDME